MLLRHDIDMSLDAALTMAKLEAEAGVSATYLLMTRSEYYNLAARSGEQTIERLREPLGHRVGLHGVYPDATLDDRFDPVFAWHTPDPEWMSLPVEGAVNAMQPEFFHPDRYRSDSNQHWRSGCPHEDLAEGRFEWLQVLVHRRSGSIPADTMRQTMESMLAVDAERRRPAAGRQRPHRSLVTAAKRPVRHSRGRRRASLRRHSTCPGAAMSRDGLSRDMSVLAASVGGMSRGLSLDMLSGHVCRPHVPGTVPWTCLFWPRLRGRWPSHERFARPPAPRHPLPGEHGRDSLGECGGAAAPGR